MAKGYMRQRSKVKGGSWSLQVYVGRGLGNGKKVYRYETVRGTKAIAEKRLREMLAEEEGPVVVVPSRMTVGEYLDEWLEGEVANTTRVRTRVGYRGVVNLYLKPWLGRVQLDRLGPKEVGDMEAGLKRRGGVGGRPLSAKTVVQAHRVLSSALAAAVRVGLVRVNVARLVKPPRGGKYEVETMSWDDVRVLVESLEAGVLRTVVVLAVLTGLRRSEIAGLRWRDIDFPGQRMSVRRAVVREEDGRSVVNAPKSGKARAVTLPVGAVEELSRYRDGLSSWESGGFVFPGKDGEPCDPGAWSKAFRRVCDQLGYPRFRFHDLRHTHASLLLEEGVHLKVVSERLGHSTVGITGDLYSHVSPNVQRDAADRMGVSWDATMGESSSGVQECSPVPEEEW